MMIKRVLIAAGGTGGHLFPAVALAERLKEKGTEVLFVCSDRPIDRQILVKNGHRFFVLKMRPFRLRLEKFLAFIFFGILGFVQSGVILSKSRPDVCVGFGGYISVPVIIFAKILGVRTIIHEQNFIPGRANKLLSNFVDRLAVSFEGTKDFFASKGAVFTGNPVRKIILNSQEEDGYKFTKFYREKFTIFVMGGSQASHIINSLLPEALFSLEEKFRKDLQVIHLAGEHEAPLVEGAYRRFGIDCRVFSFSDKVGLFYRICKLVISRAGATTISEILAMNVPSILIPYPYANGHQKLNARFLEALGGAVVLEEDRLSAEILAKRISQFFIDTSILLKMRKSIERFQGFNSTERLSEEVLSWGY